MLVQRSRPDLPSPSRSQLSADALLTRAHDTTQPPSSRFDKLVNIFHSLIALYLAAPGTEGDVKQLEEARALLSRRMDVGSHPVVLTRRVAEVHFGELSLEQQVAAVENGRTLLFDLCRTYHEQQRLPDARDLVRPAPRSPLLIAERLDSLGTSPCSSTASSKCSDTRSCRTRASRSPLICRCAAFLLSQHLSPLPLLRLSIALLR